MSFIYDGFSTTIVFGTSVGIPFRTKRLTPPPVEGGGKIDTTDMYNARIRTFAPKKLLTIGQIKGVAYYDTRIYSWMMANLQVNQGITIRFPDASAVVVYGWIESVTPPEHKEGDEPLMDFVIEVSCMTNADALGVETPPAYSVGPVAIGGRPA